MARQNHIPSYRLHKSSGQAIVTLVDSATGARKDRLLGSYGTAASRAEYARVIAEWEARGRRLDDPGPADLTVAELLVRFLAHAKTYYGQRSKEYDHFEKTGVPLTDTYPHKLAKEFGPAELKVVRERMIVHHDWSRKVVNRRVNRIRQVWKWAVEEGLAPAGTWHALLVVQGLRAGRTTARETEERKPVPEEVVAATIPHLPRHVRGLVRFQLLTGCRPEEACQVRMADVDTSREVWVYTPERHKNAWRGHGRFIGIGAETQTLLADYTAGVGPDEYVFSPWRQREEIFAAKRAARKSKVQPSQVSRRRRKPRKVPGRRFTPDSYAQAVRRTCEAHGIPRWCPYQLRHTAGARARRLLGLDAAQALLGHRTVGMTEHYSKLTVENVVEVAARIA
ncbi:MAG: tyrosine-type recombinase/integrase [Zavarzinella sp.]|nr:tyrosine-type recombinase/integrase [Zavarzinella sp.]